MRIPETTTLRRFGLLGAVGGTLTATSGLVVLGIIQPASDVSDEMWSFPWSSSALVPVSVLYAVFPASHYLWISRLLGIVVLGGMGSLPGAVVGALILGVAETLTATYISTRWSVVMFYLVILAVLLVRPQGLMGSRLRRDVAA